MSRHMRHDKYVCDQDGHMHWAGDTSCRCKLEDGNRSGSLKQNKGCQFLLNSVYIERERELVLLD